MYRTDYRLEFPALNDLAGNTFCVMATNLVNKRLFSVNGHVVNSKRVNFRSLSVDGILFFNSALKATKESLKFN